MQVAQRIKHFERLIEQATLLAKKETDPRKKELYLRAIAENKKRLSEARTPCHMGATTELPQLGNVLQNKKLRGDVVPFRNLANHDIFG